MKKLQTSTKIIVLLIYFFAAPSHCATTSTPATPATPPTSAPPSQPSTAPTVPITPKTTFKTSPTHTPTAAPEAPTAPEKPKKTPKEIAAAEQKMQQEMTEFRAGMIVNNLNELRNQKLAIIQDIENKAFHVGELRKKLEKAQRTKSDLIRTFFNTPATELDQLASTKKSADDAKTTLDNQATVIYSKTLNSPSGDLYGQIYKILKKIYEDQALQSKLNEIDTLTQQITGLVTNQTNKIHEVGEQINALTAAEQITSLGLINSLKQAVMNVSMTELQLQTPPDPKTDPRATIKLDALKELKKTNKEIMNYEKDVKKTFLRLSSDARTRIQKLNQDVQAYELILDLMRDPKRLLTISGDDIALFSTVSVCD